MINAYFSGTCFPVQPGGHLYCAFLIYQQINGVRQWTEKKSRYYPSYKFSQTSIHLAEFLSFQAILKYLINNNLQREKIKFHGDHFVIGIAFNGKKIEDGAHKKTAIECMDLLSEQFKEYRGIGVSNKDNPVCIEFPILL